MIELPKRSRPDIHADINIVPYIDVMLVLLVIFMMTTPIIEQGVEVDLPTGEATTPEYVEYRSVVTVNVEGDYYLNSMLNNEGIEETDDLTAIDLQEAVNTIIARKRIYPEMQVFVRGDREVNFQQVMDIVTSLKQFDVLDKVGFMTANPN
ncbi:biopolymer transporter ExbD [Candidatus Pseudothioglobus singularis]|jgi:biopolymer transport protein TolR|nr:biopolymer transporter ExbD [Candidatus Pseudothioglobus singularis]